MNKIHLLKDLTSKIGSGATPTGGQNAYIPNGISFIRSQNVLDFQFSTNGLAFINESQAEELKNVTVEKDDILLNITGDSIARTCIVPDNILPSRVSQHVAIIRCKEDVDSKYIFYCLQNLKAYLLKICGVGGTRNALTKDVIEKLEITLHPNPKKRAAILSTLDEKIALNQKINRELEAMAKTLYDYWFVQFDFPDEDGRPYRSSGGKMVWNELLKREVPKGWQVGNFSTWVEKVKSGDWGSEKPEGNYEQEVVCIRGADINGLNGKGALKPPTRYILGKNNFKLLASHDLIIEISGGSPTQSTGRLAYITNETLQRFEVPLICSNFCKAISLRDPKLLFNFAFYWNQVYDNGVLFGFEGKTNGIKNLLFDTFVNSFWTVIPKKTVAYRFYDFMEDLQKRKQAALSESQHLATIRDFLLPLLMNGQVRVD